LLEEELPLRHKLSALPTGRFGSREELTSHVWSLHRQQIFPNQRAIAIVCDISMDAVKRIIDTGEGLDQYLRQGCPTGG
jgi:hypothetical protein